MTENILSKYLLYALGEIILVVIGILIALQINNSNNFNQQRKVEQIYLLDLKTEFITNLEKLENCIVATEVQANAAENLLSLFDESILDTVRLNSIIEKIYPLFTGDISYTPSKGVLTDIISSGNLNLIQNKKLRQQLSSLESDLILISSQEIESLDIKNDLKDIHHKNGSVRLILASKGLQFDHKSFSDTWDVKPLFKSIEFENKLLDYYLTIKTTNDQEFYKGLKEKMELIIVEINTDLKE